MNEYRIPIRSRPRRVRSGEAAFALPKSLVARNDERALGIRLLCNRRLFGEFYRALLPQFFDSMGEESGVFIASFVPSQYLVPGMNCPGDVDLLIIPYERDELVVSMSLAVELKVVRATFAGKASRRTTLDFLKRKDCWSMDFHTLRLAI